MSLSRPSDRQTITIRCIAFNFLALSPYIRSKEFRQFDLGQELILCPAPMVLGRSSEWARVAANPPLLT